MLKIGIVLKQNCVVSENYFPLLLNGLTMATNSQYNLYVWRQIFIFKSQTPVEPSVYVLPQKKQHCVWEHSRKTCCPRWPLTDFCTKLLHEKSRTLLLCRSKFKRECFCLVFFFFLTNIFLGLKVITAFFPFFFWKPKWHRPCSKSMLDVLSFQLKGGLQGRKADCLIA